MMIARITATSFACARTIAALSASAAGNGSASRSLAPVSENKPSSSNPGTTTATMPSTIAASTTAIGTAARSTLRTPATNAATCESSRPAATARTIGAAAATSTSWNTHANAASSHPTCSCERAFARSTAGRMRAPVSTNTIITAAVINVSGTTYRIHVRSVRASKCSIVHTCRRDLRGLGKRSSTRGLRGLAARAWRSARRPAQLAARRGRDARPDRSRTRAVADLRAGVAAARLA